MKESYSNSVSTKEKSIEYIRVLPNQSDGTSGGVKNWKNIDPI